MHVFTGVTGLTLHFMLCAHDIKCNVNPLTPNHITFSLEDTKKTVIKIPLRVDFQQIKCFVFIQTKTRY